MTALRVGYALLAAICGVLAPFFFVFNSLPLIVGDLWGGAAYQLLAPLTVGLASPLLAVSAFGLARYLLEGGEDSPVARVFYGLFPPLVIAYCVHSGFVFALNAHAEPPQAVLGAAFSYETYVTAATLTLERFLGPFSIAAALTVVVLSFVVSTPYGVLDGVGWLRGLIGGIATLLAVAASITIAAALPHQHWDGRAQARFVRTDEDLRRERAYVALAQAIQRDPAAVFRSPAARARWADFSFTGGERFSGQSKARQAYARRMTMRRLADSLQLTEGEAAPRPPPAPDAARYMATRRDLKAATARRKAIQSLVLPRLAQAMAQLVPSATHFDRLVAQDFFQGMLEGLADVIVRDRGSAQALTRGEGRDALADFAAEGADRVIETYDTPAERYEGDGSRIGSLVYEQETFHPSSALEAHNRLIAPAEYVGARPRVATPDVHAAPRVRAGRH